MVSAQTSGLAMSTLMALEDRLSLCLQLKIILLMMIIFNGCDACDDFLCFCLLIRVSSLEYRIAAHSFSSLGATAIL